MTNATLQWTQGLQLVARTKEGPALIMDHPESGSGSSPMDLLLMGVAGCATMDVISILKKKRSPVTDLTVDISGERSESHPKGFTHMTIAFTVYGDGIKPTDVERSIELSVSRYCAAIATVNAKIDYHYRIESTDSHPRIRDRSLPVAPKANLNQD